MTPFNVIGMVSIVSGGMLTAFTARRPARFTAWLSAYLVLVSGVVQYGLANGWQQLGLQSRGIAIAAFVAYNVGNAAVMTGTAAKSHPRRHVALVNTGGAILAISMVLLLWSVRHAEVTSTLVWLTILTIIILVSMPAGLVLSARRRNKAA